MIFARSPYIVTIDEPAQEATRLELFIWNGTGAAPASPTYSLSKKVPSINNVTTYYNISPFLREFFDFTQSSSTTSGANVLTNQYAYCNITYKSYYTLDGVETLLSTVTDKAFDGFGYFEDSYNWAGNNILLSAIPNRSYYDCETDLSEVGTVTITTTTNWAVRYTNLSTGNQQGFSLSNNSVVNVRKIWIGWLSVGNKFEILLNNVVQATFYFIPQCECKYEVYKIDFVNRYGAWQREFFYKASTENIEITNNQFKLNPTIFPAYQLDEGQIKTFNTNAKRTYKLNTGWVEENYKQTIQELMLSEVIRVNGLPATLKTKSVEKFKSINTKTINYQMEFEMAYDVINSIS